MKRNFRWMMIYILMIFWMVGGIAYGEDNIGYLPPQPKDIQVMVSRPTISLPLFLNNNTIESIEMKLNGTVVEGRYDQELRAIVYVPKNPLKAGAYKVELSVAFKGWTKTFNQGWQFTVSENAIAALPAATEEQKQVLDYANQYRKITGLKEFQLSDALSGAALGHANYMATNKQATNEEFSNAKGFIGIKPWDRAGAFGYGGSLVVENISAGDKDHRESINGLMDAPYHRLAWLNPHLNELGYGSKDKYYAYVLGGSKLGKDTVVVYPSENQKEVATTWSGNETPNPLRLHNKSGTVGYPITLSYFSEKNIRKITVQRATITNSKGTTINSYLNTPEKDQWLQDSIILIPANPMAAGEKYTVVIKGKVEFEDNSSQAIDKTWSFTTAASTKDVNKWIDPSVTSNFGDIRGHWAQKDIVDLEKKGILTAKSVGSFKPDDKITRAEFAEVVVKALSLEIKSYEGVVKDVRINTNKSLYIEAAYREGIVRGMGNGNFEPNRLITREEMAVMMIRGFGKKGNIDLIKELPTLSFADKDVVSPWARQDVRAASKLGIIRGRIGNRFVPKDNATRAEAAVMMKRLLEKL